MTKRRQKKMNPEHIERVIRYLYENRIYFIVRNIVSMGHEILDGKQAIEVAMDPDQYFAKLYDTTKENYILYREMPQNCPHVDIHGNACLAENYLYQRDPKDMPYGKDDVYCRRHKREPAEELLT